MAEQSRRTASAWLPAPDYLCTLAPTDAAIREVAQQLAWPAGAEDQRAPNRDAGDARVMPTHGAAHEQRPTPGEGGSDHQDFCLSTPQMRNTDAA